MSLPSDAESLQSLSDVDSQWSPMEPLSPTALSPMAPGGLVGEDSDDEGIDGEDADDEGIDGVPNDGMETPLEMDILGETPLDLTFSVKPAEMIEHPSPTTPTGSPRDEDRAPQGSPRKRRWTKLSSPPQEPITVGQNSVDNAQEPITVGQNSVDNASTVSPATSEKRHRIKGKQPHSSPSPGVVRRSSEVLGEACGITPPEVRALHRLGAPPMLFWLLAVLLRMSGPGHST